LLCSLQQQTAILSQWGSSKMSTHKFQTKSTPDLDSPAILRLEETLKQNSVNLNLHGATRFEVLVERLHKSMPGLAEKSLGEILLAGDAGATAKVLSIVWDAAKDPFLTIGRRLCQVYQTENSSVKIPAAKKSSHDWGAGRASEETYTFVTIDVAKSGGLARVSKEMIEDAEWDIVQRQLRELGEAYSEFQSKFILTEMTTDAVTSQAAATANKLAFKDVTQVAYKMWKDQNRRPNVLVVNPQEFGDLFEDTAIQNWITYRGIDLVPGSQFPYVGDLRIEVTNLQAAGTALLIDTRYGGALVIRRDITVEQFDNVVEDLVELPATSRWMYKSVDKNAIGKITAA